MTDTHELKQKFWRALADSPFLFLQLDADPHTAVPMTAQLDPDANSAIWFFLARDHVFAGGGPATATFSGRGHDMFARFSGTLVPELSRERLDEEWSPSVEAWFPGGKDDPNLLMMRMDLTGEAEIWNSDLGFIDTTKMMLGFDVRDDAAREHTETTL
jgi:general stress protein 26